jgi:hypothetical protein
MTTTEPVGDAPDCQAGIEIAAATSEFCEQSLVD